MDVFGHVCQPYGQVKAVLAGIEIPVSQMQHIPLWDNTVFQTSTGVGYRSPKLVRMGVFQVGDLLVNDRLDEEKVKHIAPTWQGCTGRGYCGCRGRGMKGRR